MMIDSTNLQVMSPRPENNERGTVRAFSADTALSPGSLVPQSRRRRVDHVQLRQATAASSNESITTSRFREIQYHAAYVHPTSRPTSHAPQGSQASLQANIQMTPTREQLKQEAHCYKQTLNSIEQETCLCMQNFRGVSSVEQQLSMLPWRKISQDRK